MSRFRIDESTGAIWLPSGMKIGPESKLKDFQSMPCFESSRSYQDAPGYLRYHFDAGVYRDVPWIGSVFFYEQTVLDFGFAANLYSNTEDWSSYSLDLEADAKRLHDDVVSDMLGVGTMADCSDMAPHLTDEQTTLALPVTWSCSGFVVRSDHDFRGGGTRVTVLIGNRREWVAKAYSASTKRKP